MYRKVGVQMLDKMVFPMSLKISFTESVGSEKVSALSTASMSGAWQI